MIETIKLAKIRYAPPGSFTENALTLMTGTVIAQVIPIAVSPVLTRLYTPDIFGLFAVYSSVVSIAAVVATGRYEFAVMLPDRDEDSVNLVALSMCIALIVSLLMLIVVSFFSVSLARYLGNPQVAGLLFYVPAAVFLTGIYQALNYWSNRKKQYKRLAISRVAQSSSSSGATLGLGFFNFGGYGLVLGGILGQFMSTCVLGFQVLRDEKSKFAAVNKEQILIQAKTYIDFPKYMILAEVVCAITASMPTFMLSSLFGTAYSGYFMLTQRVIKLPLGIVGRSVGDVFKQRATQDYIKKGDCRHIYLKTLKRLFLLAVMPFLLIFFGAPFLFTLFFGEQWRHAGDYARVMSLMFFLQFLSNPLENMAYIAGKQRFELFWQIMLLFITSISFFIGYYFFKSDYVCILFFSISYAVMYLVNLLACYRFSLKK